MRRFLNNTVATGFAVFSMFFGAGNVVFPLVLGCQSGDKNLYSVIGFLITAAGVPFLGLVSMILFNGDYNKFFERLGKHAGKFAIILSMALIGPLAAIPRCVALSFSTVKSFLPGTTLLIFSLVSCVLLYFFAYKKSNVIDVIGRILSPILLISLILIIIKGVWGAPKALLMSGSRGKFFIDGLTTGYNTMDIFAGFFFSAIVIAGLKKGAKKEPTGSIESRDSIIIKTLKAGAIGVALLGAIYTGFSFVSSYYGRQLGGINPDSLISHISYYILGPYAGIIASIAASLACLTTAIALTVVFTEFFKSEVFYNKIGYKLSLFFTVAIAFAFSNIGFSGIVRMIVPILIVCYPAMIVLSIFNIAHKVWGVKIVKTPVFLTFGIALVYNLLKLYVCA